MDSVNKIKKQYEAIAIVTPHPTVGCRTSKLPPTGGAFIAAGSSLKTILLVPVNIIS